MRGGSGSISNLPNKGTGCKGIQRRGESTNMAVRRGGPGGTVSASTILRCHDPALLARQHSLGVSRLQTRGYTAVAPLGCC